MSTSKHIDGICLVAALLAVLLTFASVNAQTWGIQAADTTMGYEDRLFDTSKVHTVEIIMDDWDSFLENCENKEYAACSLVIDNQVYKNVAIRAKGNNSLISVSSYDNDRYSFKIEFDHYDSTKSYYGLDKLNLNSLIHDNTMMKDYLVYRMMGDFGVNAPLCSYVYITVNGQDWGLYLAVEGVEQGFLQRNYGSNYGDLYKPDSLNNKGMPMPNARAGAPQAPALRENGNRQFAPPDFPDGFAADAGAGASPDQRGDLPAANAPDRPDRPGGPGGMGADDVKLQYIDDDPDSYANIFDSAKTEVTEADQARLIASLKQLSEGVDLQSALDKDAVMRYFVVHNFVCNFDSYTGSMVHNYYLYEQDGVLSMLPWDYNLAFGSFQGNADATALVNFPIDTPVSGGDLSSRPMVAWMFGHEDDIEQYHQYFAQFLSAYFDNGNALQLIDQTAALIAPYVDKDPTKFCTYEEFTTAVVALKEFCALRAQSIAGQLDGSIPSTSDGQSADGTALIDASALNLSDMGAMNGGAPGGGAPRPGNAQNPTEDTQQTRNNQTLPSDQTMVQTAFREQGDQAIGVHTLAATADQENLQTDQSAAAPPAQDRQEPLEGQPNNTPADAPQMPQPPSMEQGQSPFSPDMQTANNQNGDGAAVSISLWLVIACAFVLAFGLVFAFLFKRK